MPVTVRMTIYPAIDIRGGRAVRLEQGDFGRETVYGADPVEVALRFRDAGAAALHVVDLDGARTGAPAHLDLLEAIATRTGLPVQFGGGLRSQAAIDAALRAGASRVVLGTRALEPEFLAEARARHGDAVLVGLDARAGKVAVRGWQETSHIDLADAARAVLAAGCREIIYTEVGRDGMLAGPDVEGLEGLLRLGCRAIASGGVASLAHVRRLAALGPMGLVGMIIGKALYSGAIRLQDALAAARREEPQTCSRDASSPAST